MTDLIDEANSLYRASLVGVKHIFNLFLHFHTKYWYSIITPVRVASTLVRAFVPKNSVRSDRAPVRYLVKIIR